MNLSRFCGRFAQDITNRSRRVLELSTIPQWDEIRHQMMVGVCGPLNANFAAAGLARINYCWHFHAASTVEAVARFVRVARQTGAVGVAPLLNELFAGVEVVLRSYWDGWDNRTYVVPCLLYTSPSPRDS